MLVDLRNMGVSGSKAEYVCEQVDISLNKNSVFGDTSAINPGGIRIGTPALTTRGLVESDFEKVGEYIDRVIKLCQEVQNISGKKLKDFKETLHNQYQGQLDELKYEVNIFADKYEFVVDENFSRA
jgi:glycine hydroxymethyltransferase